MIRSIGNLDKFRSLEQWQCPSFSYASVDEFECSQSLHFGIHAISAAELCIDLYIDLQPGCPLVFFFNGAKVRDDNLKLPFFAGLRVLPPGKVSRIYISDPSLYLEAKLSLGWYAGSHGLPLQQLLPRILRHIIARARPSKVMFTGGSGGGFAALYYSRLFSRSLAIVWNPQTNILKSYSAHLAAYAEAAFGLNTHEAITSFLPTLIQTDLCSLYASGRHDNYIIYLQNESDSFHVESHFKPFLSGYDGASNYHVKHCSSMMRPGIFAHRGHWGDGHATPPRDWLIKLYEHLLSYDGEWCHLFSGRDNLVQLLIQSKFAAIIV